MNEFVVKPKIAFWVGITWTALGWSSVVFWPESFISLKSPFPSIVNQTYELLLLGFMIFFGPIILYRNSWVIVIRNDNFIFKRHFNLDSKTYDRKDLNRVELIPKSKRKGPRVKIEFANGKRITINSLALNFKQFWDYLRKEGND